MYYVYLLRCDDNSLYTGITTNLERRFAQHTGLQRSGAKYTASHRPVRLEAAWRAPNRSAASKLEYRIKALAKVQKEQLLHGAYPAGLHLTVCRKISITSTGRIVPMLFVCYPACSTCKKARAFLDTKDAVYEVRDIKTQHPTEEELRRWHAKSGLPLKRFFNTSGQIYRALALSQKLPNMSEDEQFALLATDGMLVKRPILVSDDAVLVGFKQAEWESNL